MRDITVSPKRSRSFGKIIFLTAILLFLTFVLIKFLNWEKLVFRGPTTVVKLITDTGLESDRGQVNVLLLGTGGSGHEGPDLSDTMILASIEKDRGDVVLISIPRDLWTPSLSAKINAAYAFGQEKNGEGLALAKKTVRELFDLPIHYAFRLDFGGFTKAIDLVGGIDLDVETAFVDEKYPIAGKEDDSCGIEIETKDENGIGKIYFKDATGEATLLTDENDPFVCRYETISFKKGPAHIDGATALKFVRSRHGTNGQGSDFARSARQQKVILAFRQNVLSTETFTSPNRIIDLAKTFGDSIDTDITNDEIPHFAKLAPKIDPVKIRRVVLDSERPESVLQVGDPKDHAGQFVLIPKNNNWHDLAEFIQGEIFKTEEN